MNTLKKVERPTNGYIRILRTSMGMDAPSLAAAKIRASNESAVGDALQSVIRKAVGEHAASGIEFADDATFEYTIDDGAIEGIQGAVLPISVWAKPNT